MKINVSERANFYTTEKKTLSDEAAFNYRGAS